MEIFSAEIKFLESGHAIDWKSTLDRPVLGVKQSISKIKKGFEIKNDKSGWHCRRKLFGRKTEWSNADKRSVASVLGDLILQKPKKIWPF